jgi:hypothetical protein
MMGRFQKFSEFVDLDFWLGMVYIAAWLAVFIAAGGTR